MASSEGCYSGEVVKLDRGYPLVKLADGRAIRCEHSTDLVKHVDLRAVIGDRVEIAVPPGHDVGVIEQILPRTSVFVRKDPTERAVAQTLAANFDKVIISQPVTGLNLRRLERELVLAHQATDNVSVVLTKADLADGDALKLDEAIGSAKRLAGNDVQVLSMAADDPRSVERVRSLIPEGTTAVLIGKSGVGKSTMINILSGTDSRATGNVRKSDGKGRHTTVSREIVQIPNGGRVVDMPGVRGLGLWDAEEGIEAAFSDVEELAQGCRFRDCRHTGEPGCAVCAAVDEGSLAKERLDSYLALRKELDATNDRRKRSSWKNR